MAIDGAKRRLPLKVIGVIVILGVVLFGVFAFSKNRVASYVTPGDTVNAEFSRDYKLIDFQGVVKLAGVTVGEITSVSKTERGTTLVSMRVDNGVVDKLGGIPTAAIRPTLVVGGIYYVALTSGGLGNAFPDGGTIPIERTSVPVELDRVATALTPAAQKGLQTTVKQTEGTLAGGGQQAVQGLLQAAPGTLRPAGAVLDAVRGTQPDDLPRLVDGLERTATVLNRKPGQFAAILDSLGRTSTALNASRIPFTESLRKAPDTLRTTRAGLKDLNGTLDRLEETAPAFQPSAKKLAKVLNDLDPTLQRARPVIKDLRGLLDELYPLVKRLDPTVDKLDGVFGDLKGPVLDRLNGPIMDAVNTDWHGTGIYQNGGSPAKFYEEAGYLAAVGADVFKFKDNNGGMARLMAGAGANSAAGGSKDLMPLEKMLEGIGLGAPPGPQEGRGSPRSEFATPYPSQTPLAPLPSPLTGGPGR